MRLIDLKPEWRENPPGNKYLHFKCPTCTPKDLYCLITIAVDNTVFPDGTWRSENGPGFETLTLTPSLQHHCATSPHFYITNGSIIIL